MMKAKMISKKRDRDKIIKKKLKKIHKTHKIKKF